MATGSQHKSRPSIAKRVRRRIERRGERFWRVQDFPGLPATAVAKALARLVDVGALERPRRGLYYRPRATSFGQSRPSPSAIAHATLRHEVQPAGLTAANILGLTTQNLATAQLVTSANNAPPWPQPAQIRARRPQARSKLSQREAALLEVLRDRGRTSDLAFRGTRRRLLAELEDAATFRRLARAAAFEPPRVRALLGALGQEMGADPRSLKELKSSLNPLSKFDFGRLRPLKHAAEWQAK